MTEEYSRRLGGAIGIIVALFLIGLLGRGCNARGDEPQPYPVGDLRGGAVGGKHAAWVRLRHRVTRAENGRYHYRYEFELTRPAVATLAWDVPRSCGGPLAFHLRANVVEVFEFTSSHAPVWHHGDVKVYLSPIGRDTPRLLAGTWWQGGPVPGEKGVDR